MNNFLRITLLIIFTLVITLLIAEGLARSVFDPIDFLKPKKVQDDILRYRLEPNTGAHDSWGFRNTQVPDSAGIVTIGDSHTYGISATASNSWPAVLSDISGDTVYNISLGGYGPAEYLYLMENKALGLNPHLIIAGLYLGNDLKDSYNTVYTVDYWKDLRRPHDNDGQAAAEADEKHKSPGLGEWLSGHSVLYRLISSSALGDQLRQRRRIERGEEIVMFEHRELGISTGFTPRLRLKGLDLNRPDVEEGLGLSLEFIERMNELSKQNGIDFLVVIIPTKENVYSNYIKSNKSLSKSDEIDYLIENESKVNKIVRDYFRENGIRFVDVLEPLQTAAGKEQIYPNNFGGHTNKNGYKVIAETLNVYLESYTDDN